MELKTCKVETKNLEELKAIAKDLLNKADDAENLTDKNAYESDLDEVISFYTACSKEQCYQAAKESGDPMKYAITEFFFNVIRVKETKDKASSAVTRSIDDAQKPIDLGDLHKKLDGIGADTKWIHTLETLNYYLSIRAAKRVNAATLKTLQDNVASFKMSDIARGISLGKDPTSNTNMLKTLRLVVSQMIGTEFEGKVTSHDVNYLIDVYATDNKKSKTGITAANHKTLRGYLKKVCYRVLTGGTGYDVEQREFKAE